MTNKVLIKIFFSLLSLLIVYRLVNFIFYTKEKFALPINVKEINKIYNISIFSDFDYYIGNTSFYKNKKIIFYKFDKNHVITIIKNGKITDLGIKNNKLYPITLKELISSFHTEKLNCKKISTYNLLSEDKFNINITTDKEKINLIFLKDYIYILENIKGYNSLFQKDIIIKRYFKCNFDIYMYNDFIIKLKKLSIIKKNVKE